MNSTEQKYLKTLSNILLAVGVIQLAADFPYRVYISAILGGAFVTGQAIAHYCADPTPQTAVTCTEDIVNATVIAYDKIHNASTSANYSCHSSRSRNRYEHCNRKLQGFSSSWSNHNCICSNSSILNKQLSFLFSSIFRQINL